MTRYFNWYGAEQPFKILSVIPSYLGLRVIFSKPCVNNAAFRTPEYYQITVASPSTSFDFGCVSVTPESGVTYPEYVDLEMTDNTHGKDYTLVITSGMLEAQDGTFLVAPLNTADFVGVSEMPVVLATIPLSLTTARVVFSKIMSLKSELTNIALYVWTGGLRTLKAEIETDSTVLLTTTEQTPAGIYDLTVG